MVDKNSNKITTTIESDRRNAEEKNQSQCEMIVRDATIRLWGVMEMRRTFGSGHKEIGRHDNTTEIKEIKGSQSGCNWSHTCPSTKFLVLPPHVKYA